MAAMRWSALVLVLGVLGCSRPSDEDCRRALRNVRKISGAADTSNAPDPEPAIRKCKSSASTEQVACLIAAKTQDDVAACQQK